MEDISLHLLDILQNSVSAGATLITCRFVKIADRLQLSIVDNGKGMDEETRKAAQDPFYTSKNFRKKKIGLGIPLFAQSAKMSGGDFSLESEVGEGTRIEVEFVVSNIDALPLGDVALTLVNCIVAHQSIDFVLEIICEGEEKFVLDTRVIKKEMDGISLELPEVRKYLVDAISHQVSKLEV